jgi:hypothetical protein
MATEDPYPGLRPFEAGDSQFFFGRDSQIERVLDRLGSELHMVFIVGPSGCGKSSLIRAGVIPRLCAFGLPKQGYVWIVTTCTPGRQPRANLIAALSSVLQMPPGHSAERAVDDFLQERQELGSFVTYFKDVLDVSGGNTSEERQFSSEEVNVRRHEANLLILVDQFEELFAAEGPPSKEAANFVEIIASTLRRVGSSRVFLVLTMRTENLRELATFPELPSLLNQAQFYITAPDEAEFEQIIVRPGRRFLNKHIQDDGTGGDRIRLAKRGYPFTPELLDLLLQQVTDLRHDPDHLPLLQHLLRALWLGRGQVGEGQLIETSLLARILGCEDLRNKLETAQPGWMLRKALDVYAEDVYRRLYPEHDLTDAFLRLLVDRGEGGVMTRRQTTPEEVLQVAGHNDNPKERERFWTAVAAFQSPHPLIRYREEHLDVAHEALLRNWQRFRRASESERGVFDALRHVIDRYCLWQKKPDQVNLLDAQALERWREWRDKGNNVAWHTRYADILTPVGIGNATQNDSQARLPPSLEKSVRLLREYWDRSEAEIALARRRERRRAGWIAFGIAAGTAAAIVVFALFILYKNATVQEELAAFDGVAVNITAAALEITQHIPYRHIVEEDGYRLKQAVALANATDELRVQYDDALKQHSWFSLWHGYWDRPSDGWDARIQIATAAADRATYEAITSGISSRVSWPPSGDGLPDLLTEKGISCAQGKKDFIILQQQEMPGTNDHMGRRYTKVVAREAGEVGISQVFFGWYLPPNQGSAEPIECHFPVSGTVALEQGASRLTVDTSLETLVIQYPIVAPSVPGGEGADLQATVHVFYRIDWIPSCDPATGNSCTPGLVPIAEQADINPINEGPKNYMPLLGHWYNLKWTPQDPTVARRGGACNPKPRVINANSQASLNEPDCTWDLSGPDERQISLSMVVTRNGLVRYTVTLSRVQRGSAIAVDGKIPRQTVAALRFWGPEADEIELDSDDSIDFKLRGSLGYGRFAWNAMHFRDMACSAMPRRAAPGVEPLANYSELRQIAGYRFASVAAYLDSDPCAKLNR